jgi:hypothetical protein
MLLTVRVWAGKTLQCSLSWTTIIATAAAVAVAAAAVAVAAAAAAVEVVLFKAFNKVDLSLGSNDSLTAMITIHINSQNNCGAQ